MTEPPLNKPVVTLGRKKSLSNRKKPPTNPGSGRAAICHKSFWGEWKDKKAERGKSKDTQ